MLTLGEKFHPITQMNGSSGMALGSNSLTILDSKETYSPGNQQSHEKLDSKIL